jgi:hypothetical protein
MSVLDPYSIPIRIFTWREWRQDFTIADTEIRNDSLALVVIPAAGGAALLENTTPVFGSGTGSCTFVYTDADTGTLTPGGFRWQLLRKPQFATLSDLLVAGKLTVSSSPPYPNE